MTCHESPLHNRYQHYLCEQGYDDDPVQRRALDHLQRLQLDLCAPHSKSPQGLYLWGPVGRGKTFLMDLFCDSLPEGSALRLHFHRFMAMIHQQLLAHAGEPDPLQVVAADLSRQYKVLCFDEFLVGDIGDAMLLGRLIKHLFADGVALVSTSNRPPHELYQGLHADRFAPTVQLLQERMEVLPLHGEKDHRFRTLTHSQAYFVEDAGALDRLFNPYRSTQLAQRSTVSICRRDIPCVALAEHAVWFEFDALCEGPRSHLDYIDIAQRFHTVILNDVPLLGGKQFEQIKARGTEDGAIGSQGTGERQVLIGRSDDSARRFIALVDELYDRRVNLFLNAAAPLGDLYQGNLLSFEFQRTRSRLTEMASQEYQTSPHQP